MVSFNKLYEPSDFFSKDSCFVENKRDRSFGLEFYNTILCGTVIPLFRRKSSAEYFELKG